MKLTRLFPQDIRPVRSGVYMTPHGPRRNITAYSYYDADDRIWGVYAPDVEAAAKAPQFEFANQQKVWRGIHRDVNTATLQWMPADDSEGGLL